MTRVAAIDCGTNSVKLLVADLDPASGQEHEHVRTLQMVRLGQDVDRTGRLADEALERVFAAVDDFSAVIASHDVEAVRFCATSAVRDAENADVFADGVQARLGVRPEVLPGSEEARLTYDGATRGLPAGDVEPPVLVVDIGGGSTELVLGDGHGHVTASVSLDVGSVRMTERHALSDPPTPDEVAATVADVDTALERCDVDVAGARTVVGVAGTVTTLASGLAVPGGTDGFERERIDGLVLAREDIDALTARILAATVAERRSWRWMNPRRADVIGAGAIILERVLTRAGTDRLRVSVADVLDGIAWSLVGGGSE